MGKHKTRILAKAHLRSERLTQGWIARDFARRVGISRASLSAIELRKQGLSERVAVEMAKVLHVEFDALFEVLSVHTAEREDEEALLVA